MENYIFESELNKPTKPLKDMTIRELWNHYWNHEEWGLDIEYFNGLVESIDQMLPYKNEEEHEKVLDMMSLYRGEPEFDDLMDEIIKRTETKRVSIKDDSDDFYYKGRKYTIVCLEGRDGLSHDIEALMLNFVNDEKSTDFVDLRMIEYTFGNMTNSIAKDILKGEGM